MIPAQWCVFSFGSDTMSGDQEDDVLIGGHYTLADDLDAVAALMAAWTSPLSFTDRAAALKSGVGAGLYALNTSTVLDDVVSDNLSGDQQRDWFLVGAGDSTDTSGTNSVN